MVDAAVGAGDDREDHAPCSNPIKKKRKMPKNKSKHGRNARLGGNKKNYNRKAAAMARASPPTVGAATAHVPSLTAQPATAIRKRPMPAREARKAAGYAKRSLRHSMRKVASQKKEITKISDTHVQEMAKEREELNKINDSLVKERAKTNLKSQRCIKLAALDVGRRRRKPPPTSKG